ncbi:hypothetical protein OBA47_01570 [bacterium]|nr:hypothetical protein [bacterium]
MRFGDKDPMSLGLFLLLIALRVCFHLDQGLDQSSLGTVSRHWDRWHPAVGGHVLQARLDQSLLGLV